MPKSERKSLEEKAVSLGVKYVGVSTEDLKNAVAEAEAKTTESTGGEDVAAETPAPEAVEEATTEPEADVAEEPVKVKKEKPNAAIFMNGKNEVRRFTIKSHGKDFEKVAEQFAKKFPNYDLVVKHVEPEILCPHCGRKIYKN